MTRIDVSDENPDAIVDWLIRAGDASRRGEMMRRRQFLGGALALPVAAKAGLAEMPPSTDGRVTVAICNSRFSSCRAFAAESRRLGALVLDAGLGPFDFWYEHFRKLDLARIRLVGLAPYSDFDVFRDCTLGSDIKALYEGLHGSRRSVGPTHQVVCGADGLDLQTALRHAGPHWPCELAQTLVGNVRRFVPPERLAWFYTKRPSNFRALLASWLIA